MSENSNETANNEVANETPAVESATEQPAERSCCKRGSCCKPHTSIIISLIALILAGYAAFTAAPGQDNTAIETRLGNMDSQIASVNDQITTLDEAVKSNRENLIQTKLKKALQNIQEIGNLAGEGTKAAISEVENMLKTLTEISAQLTAPAPTETMPPASIEPAPEPAVESAAETVPETSAPAEIAQPEATPSESTPSEPTLAEPTTTAPDSSAADQTPVTAETTPAQPADTPPADATPAAEPSAPQAF